MNKHTELRFEEAIEYCLTTDGGYSKGDPNKFNAELGLFPDDIISFIEKTQSRNWQLLLDIQKHNARTTLLESLCKELISKGALHVLRQGFKCFGKTYHIAYFAPNSNLNEEAWRDYAANQLTITRQVHFSIKTPNDSIDIVLSVNGLPVVTLELKNPMTGQTAEHAQKQYCTRDPREQLFKFKERALVHFAVDPDVVYMTTKLASKETVFLPFNKGHNKGAGNPPQERNYRTAYLWEQALTKDSLLDILARFIHLQVEEKKVITHKGVQTNRKETIVFPRYHQLDVVRKLLADTKIKGTGHNYLIQHSAGSGKSNSIAWLAHRLANLHNEQDKKIFDTVVVITDRRVLDKQLQDTIYQFDHKQGVVQKIDEDTQQLVKALSSGVPIIISTIQKFPVITKALETLAKKGEEINIDTTNRRFAVIVDEAHSSQSGETAMELRKILNKSGIEAAIAEQWLDNDEDEILSPEAKAGLLKEMLKRTKQPNISYFAFTATPKYKTLQVFDEPGENGSAPFHLYSMRQAIEEKFIMDVLANYTTYKTYMGLVKSVEDDPEVPKKKAAKALARFMSMHAYNISQKVEVIVEHFRLHTKHKIGGRAKAMVVTGSRLHAVRYKLTFDKYLQEKGYTDIKSLVAFSGTVTDPDFPDKSYTEVSMNKGIKELELPEKFDTEEYQVLLVADKYQTGFDQPLLHSMYVDKRLAGVQAVQTLSRLNRIAKGKEDTFVLDFVNEPADIYEAFKPYYETTTGSELSDPHQLYDLQHRLRDWLIFSNEELNAYCEIWFANRKEPLPHEHREMNAIIDRAVERFNLLDEEQRELFKTQIKSFVHLYTFLSQVIPYQDSDLEKLYTYLRFLYTKLPHRSTDVPININDEVALKYYRLEKISEGRICLKVGEPEALHGPSEVGTGNIKDERVNLSLLIDALNARFGTDFTKADELFFDQIRETAISNEKLREAAKANNIDNFRYVFEKMLMSLFVERIEGNEEIFTKIMNDDEFKRVATEHLLRVIYNDIRDN